MAKSHFHLDPPPGFRGLDPREKLERYERNLPHWRQEGATYFVTFRLADSLPQSKLTRLKSLREALEEKIKANPAMSREERDKLWTDYAKLSLQKTETWLDSGMGTCLLEETENRRAVREAFRFFDSNRHETGACVIMPNHVHALLRPLAGFSLERILHSIKRESSRQINARVGRSGSLWQEESYDRIVRNSEHLWKCLQYIGANPAKANLKRGDARRWVREPWKELGWDFVDGDERGP